jgi:type IV pilus assembly protein PilM
MNHIYHIVLDRLKSALKFRLGISKIHIGLDIGSDSIKCVKIKRKGESYKLLSYRIISIAHLKSKPSEEKFAEISKILRSMLRIKDSIPVFTAVSGSNVIIKSFNIARISGAKLRNAVFWASKKYVPFPLEEAYFDYKVLGDIEEKETKKKEIIVVAAAKQLIHNLLDLFKKSGLKVPGITVTPFTLCNLFKITKNTHSSSALIDIGAENTCIVIFQNNTLKFAREIVTSGNSITEFIASSTFLSLDEAEKLKKGYGLSKTEASDEFIKAIMPVVERLINEIQRSFSFYKEKHPDFTLEKIYLTGGTARLKGLPQFMKNRLKADVEIIDSIEKLAISPPSTDSDEFNHKAPVFMKAVSLALETDDGIDLLPPKAKHQRTINRVLPILRISALFIIFFCFILYVDILARVQIKRKSLDFWYSNMQRVNQLVLNPAQIQIKSDRYQIMKKTLDKLDEREIVDPFILKEITNIIPESIKLENLSIYSPEELEKQENTSKAMPFQIEGIVCGKEIDLEVDLLQFLVTLDFSPFFKNPVLLEKKREILAGKDILRFAIDCDLE